jgi:hypothetical protein
VNSHHEILRYHRADRDRRMRDSDCLEGCCYNLGGGEDISGTEAEKANVMSQRSHTGGNCDSLGMETKVKKGPRWQDLKETKTKI